MSNKVGPLVHTVRAAGLSGSEPLEPKGPVERALSREDVRSVVRGVHVVPETAGGWEVRKVGRRRVVRHFETKNAAVLFAETLAVGGCDLYIHDRPPGILRKPLRAGS